MPSNFHESDFPVLFHWALNFSIISISDVNCLSGYSNIVSSTTKLCAKLGFEYVLVALSFCGSMSTQLIPIHSYSSLFQFQPYCSLDSFIVLSSGLDLVKCYETTSRFPVLSATLASYFHHWYPTQRAYHHNHLHIMYQSGPIELGDDLLEIPVSSLALFPESYCTSAN